MINNHNLKKVYENIQQISPKTKLIIVSKTRKIDDIDKLLAKQNFIFGENRVQEAQDKFDGRLDRSKIELHLIGPLQTNKVPLALNIFDTIQTIDRKKLVDTISTHIQKKIMISRQKTFLSKLILVMKSKKVELILKILMNYTTIVI